MKPPTIAIESYAIVVKGFFNPVIFSPSWLLSQGLIGKPEVDEQDIDVISRDVVVFRAGWLAVQVTPDALQLSTTNVEELERLRDAMIGVLRTLGHTPVGAVGLNREVHFVVDNAAQWHAVGDQLAPKAYWDGTLESPGMRTLVLWGERPDKYAGRVQVQVEPSTRVPQAVYVGVNDHFDLTTPPPLNKGSREIVWDLTVEPLMPSADLIDAVVAVLTEEWHASMQRAEGYLAKVSNLREVR